MENPSDIFNFEKLLEELGKEIVSWQSGEDAIRFPFQPSTIIPLTKPLVVNLPKPAVAQYDYTTMATWAKSERSSLTYTVRTAVQRAFKIGLSQVVPGCEATPPIFHNACDFSLVKDGLRLRQFSKNPLFARSIGPDDRIIHDIANPLLDCLYSACGALEKLSLTIPAGDSNLEFLVPKENLPLVEEEVCALRTLDAIPIDIFSRAHVTFEPTFLPSGDRLSGVHEEFLDVYTPVVTETLSVPPRGTTLRITPDYKDTDLHCSFPLTLTRESIRAVIALTLGRLF